MDFGHHQDSPSMTLVGGLEHGFHNFPYIGNVIIPTDALIFFRGVGITNQDMLTQENSARRCSRLANTWVSQLMQVQGMSEEPS
jgi:hypothetical protein